MKSPIASRLQCRPVSATISFPLEITGLEFKVLLLQFLLGKWKTVAVPKDQSKRTVVSRTTENRNSIHETQWNKSLRT